MQYRPSLELLQFVILGNVDMKWCNDETGSNSVKLTLHSEHNTDKNLALPGCGLQELKHQSTIDTTTVTAVMRMTFHLQTECVLSC